MMAASTSATPIPSAARAELAPTGKLRAGINFQNALLTSLGPNGEQGEVAVDLVRELARRLDVALEILPYQSAGALADSVKTGDWDVAVPADEPARAKEIAFAGATTEIEATYLVPAGSPLKKIDDVDREQRRQGLSVAPKAQK